MRLAISSCVLAARSLLSGEDYDTLWRRELKPQMEPSVVNRVLYRFLGKRGCDLTLGMLASRPNFRESLRKRYRLPRTRTLLYPWARRRFRSQRKDEACDHKDCHCIWCRGECCIGTRTPGRTVR